MLRQRLHKASLVEQCHNRSMGVRIPETRSGSSRFSDKHDIPGYTIYLNHLVSRALMTVYGMIFVPRSLSHPKRPEDYGLRTLPELPRKAKGVVP